ncbi:MAG TPA: ABC transporter ATP-binding protein [Burkholderiales bacterium]|nr:ABC transporter ATP-binding protein [Burkholderiales bacterium]
MSLLVATGLAKSFGGVAALRGVSFSVARGELLALIGPNGAGKTTCFNVVNGQLRPDRGQVRFEGRRIDGLPPRRLCRLGIGRTFQVASTFASMSVRENVQVVERDPARAESVLRAAGVGALAGRQCAELAYGDLKRVELAIALASRPRLLLMDEPTAGMASAERRALMDIVRDAARAQDIAVLFTEHDMDVVFGFADRVLVLAEGELIAQGAPAAVRSDARVRRVYLGEEAADA